jgi:hypothetical protein
MQNLFPKENELFSIINNTDEHLEFKLDSLHDNNNNNFNFDINKIYSLYPMEKFEEKFNFEENKENILVKFYYDYGNITRDYKLNSFGNYSFEQEGVLKDLNTNKFFGEFNVKLFIRNTTENPIDIRVSNNGIGNDNEFILNKLDMDAWERYAGEVIVQIREKNSIFRFKLNCPGKLFYKGEGILVERNLSYRNDKNLKFKNDIGAVTLRNNSGNKVNVRFSTNGIGNADFWPINYPKSESWNRNYGNVFLEIKIDHKTSFQYVVEVPKKYVYNGNGVLLEEFTNKEILTTLNAKF